MTIELPGKVEEQLRSLAAKQGRDIGEIVEAAVLDYLEAAASYLPLPRVGDRALSDWAADLSSMFSLEDQPVGALDVQEMSRSAGLEPDELSRALVQAREE
ncbi:MAG TPA: ribbon-helix-helix protein, CopG family [Thermoanaerobaculia bacterium]|nr:ribbon-helix-helix protein, CopG family [Thermoanaerobaculia bacterium]